LWGGDEQNHLHNQRRHRSILEEASNVAPQRRIAAEAGMSAKAKLSWHPRKPSKPQCPYTDDELLEYLEWRKLSVKSRGLPTGALLEIFKTMSVKSAKNIIQKRRRARKPRKKSDAVQKRLEAVANEFLRLPEKLREEWSSTETVGQVRDAVLRRLGISDDDDVLSEDTIRKDLSELGPMRRLVQTGVLPPFPLPIQKSMPPSDTIMDSRRRAAAKLGGKNRGKLPPGKWPNDPDLKIPEAVSKAAKKANKYYGDKI
jgi:hypothetical protein